MVDLRSKGRWFETHQGLCVVFSLVLYSLYSSDITQEDRKSSRHE